MIYSVYKNIRDNAWQFLIDYNIKSLPVDLLYIAESAGIQVVRNSDVNILSGGESGRCIYNEKKDKWHLIYDDECTVGRRRFTIAHELAHIFLGHELIYGETGRTFSSDKPQSEIEADTFAMRLLAPACVLKELGITTAEDIEKLCGISKTSAKIRVQRMAKLYKNSDHFYESPLEKQVGESFKYFIDENKQR